MLTMYKVGCSFGGIGLARSRGVLQTRHKLPNTSSTSKSTERKRAPAPARKRSAIREPASASAADVFETLRVRIAQQHIAPGAKLNEMDLAEEFGVSRARVRDALSALEQR